jgi:hypothetical protein
VAVEAIQLPVKLADLLRSQCYMSSLKVHVLVSVDGKSVLRSF